MILLAPPRPTNQPAAWMMPCIIPVPSPVLCVGDCSLALLDHSCQVPTWNMTRPFGRSRTRDVSSGKRFGSSARLHGLAISSPRFRRPLKQNPPFQKHRGKVLQCDRRSLDGNVSGGRNRFFCYVEKALSLANHLLSTSYDTATGERPTIPHGNVSGGRNVAFSHLDQTCPWQVNYFQLVGFRRASWSRRRC